MLGNRVIVSWREVEDCSHVAALKTNYSPRAKESLSLLAETRTSVKYSAGVKDALVRSALWSMCDLS